MVFIDVHRLWSSHLLCIFVFSLIPCYFWNKHRSSVFTSSCQFLFPRWLSFCEVLHLPKCSVDTNPRSRVDLPASEKLQHLSPEPKFQRLSPLHNLQLTVAMFSPWFPQADVPFSYRDAAAISCDGASTDSSPVPEPKQYQFPLAPSRFPVGFSMSSPRGF